MYVIAFQSLTFCAVCVHERSIWATLITLLGTLCLEYWRESSPPNFSLVEMPRTRILGGLESIGYTVLLHLIRQGEQKPASVLRAVNVDVYQHVCIIVRYDDGLARR
ncbi:hypothetical protein C8R44DRAFT_249799 [Mycena epipterygia]|nr:hypothetical protein C8R44DRAFT_249799 [Mycena epipterygia]